MFQRSCFNVFYLSWIAELNIKIINMFYMTYRWIGGGVKGLTTIHAILIVGIIVVTAVVGTYFFYPRPKTQLIVLNALGLARVDRDILTTYQHPPTSFVEHVRT